jgi:hypothetical protein
MVIWDVRSLLGEWRLRVCRDGRMVAILASMDLRHIPWHIFITAALKLLAKFGLIPGAAVGYGVKSLYQRRRQGRAAAGWPSTDATVQSGKVHKQGARQYWVELTYIYFVEEYRSGKHVHRFRKEAEADDFLGQIKDKRIQIRYNPAKPDESAILDRDLEMVVLLSPLRG